MTRIIILHKKTDPIEQIDAWAKQLEALAEATSGMKGLYTITSAREDHAARSGNAGSFEAWARDVAVGIDPQTRQPRYDWFIVVGNGSMGKITAQIVKMALERNAPVYWLGPDAICRKVEKVEWAGGQWKDGWSVGIAP